MGVAQKVIPQETDQAQGLLVLPVQGGIHQGLGVVQDDQASAAHQGSKNPGPDTGKVLNIRLGQVEKAAQTLQEGRQGDWVFQGDGKHASRKGVAKTFHRLPSQGRFSLAAPAVDGHDLFRGCSRHPVPQGERFAHPPAKGPPGLGQRQTQIRIQNGREDLDLPFNRGKAGVGMGQACIEDRHPNKPGRFCLLPQELPTGLKNSFRNGRPPGQFAIEQPGESDGGSIWDDKAHSHGKGHPGGHQGMGDIAQGGWARLRTDTCHQTRQVYRISHLKLQIPGGDRIRCSIGCFKNEVISLGSAPPMSHEMQHPVLRMTDSLSEIPEGRRVKPFQGDMMLQFLHGLLQTLPFSRDVQGWNGLSYRIAGYGSDVKTNSGQIRIGLALLPGQPSQKGP